ncbi:GOLPH3/VPS74 family protein [Rhizomonospora bruguierae]|uniref:GOLPH3/VPS74 family protein n=1 Tax=Rhizomonospora bruguierae TaxID=1581705 RepID=UPI001BD00E63|nr:GPP34 family phosphoprotein [Micromonospora sp. NBRC 107566]
MTSLALAEELLLLAYDDETGKATGSRIGLDLGMAAAVLIELALAGRIALADGGLLAAPGNEPTGDPIADDALRRICADTPHTPASWVQRLRHGLRERVLADLVGRGIVREVDETALEFIPVHRYPAVDPAPEAEVRARLAAALTGGADLPPRTAALATLVAAARMEPTLNLPEGEAAKVRARLEEIANSAGFAGTVSADTSTVRPSVAIVVAALIRAVDTALGALPADHPRR